MHGFDSILVYASFEDEDFLALEQAASLARASGASITLMRVLEDDAALTRWMQRSGSAVQLSDQLIRSQRELLEHRVKELRREGLDVEVDVRWGTPWLELIRSAIRDGHDLVVKAAEGAARSRGLFFGSTALHLIRKCPCPVWVVGGNVDDRPRRVLAALDPSPDEVRSAVAARVLNMAASMAGENGELHAVSAWRAAGETLLANRMSPDELADYVRTSREETRKAVDDCFARVGETLPPERVHLVKGHARDVLPRWVAEHEVDLVVLGSLGRVGIAGFLIGETAETLIRSVRCSVLVVKPPGFVSPVAFPDEPTTEAADSGPPGAPAASLPA